MIDTTQDRRDVETLIRMLSDPLRRMADQHRRAGMVTVADDLVLAADMATRGVLGTSPALSTADSYMYMIAPIRDAASRHGLVVPIENSLPEEPPAPAATEEHQADADPTAAPLAGRRIAGKK
jgi:hypothetical protein